MFAENISELLTKSVKVINIPLSLDQQDIILVFKDLGEIENTIHRQDKLIITYARPDQREASQALNGFQLNEKYSIQLEDPTRADFENGETAVEEVEDGFEVIRESSECNSPTSGPQKDKMVEEDDDDKYEVVETVNHDEENAKCPSLSEKEQREHTPDPIPPLEGQGLVNKETATSKVREEDPFDAVLAKKYLIAFTFGWALLTFIRSIF